MKKKKYDFKPYQELLWFIAAATIPVLGQALFEFDPSKITDMNVWITALMAALVRGLGGALLAWWAKTSI